MQVLVNAVPDGAAGLGATGSALWGERYAVRPSVHQAAFVANFQSHSRSEPGGDAFHPAHWTLRTLRTLRTSILRGCNLRKLCPPRLHGVGAGEGGHPDSVFGAFPVSSHGVSETPNCPTPWAQP